MKLSPSSSRRLAITAMTSVVVHLALWVTLVSTAGDLMGLGALGSSALVLVLVIGPASVGLRSGPLAVSIALLSLWAVQHVGQFAAFISNGSVDPVAVLEGFLTWSTFGLPVLGALLTLHGLWRSQSQRRATMIIAVAWLAVLTIARHLSRVAWDVLPAPYPWWILDWIAGALVLAPFGLLGLVLWWLRPAAIAGREAPTP